MNVGQSGMTISGDRNQSGGRFEGQPRMTEGFNAVKRSYGVLPPDGKNDNEYSMFGVHIS